MRARPTFSSNLRTLVAADARWLALAVWLLFAACSVPTANVPATEVTDTELAEDTEEEVTDPFEDSDSVETSPDVASEVVVGEDTTPSSPYCLSAEKEPCRLWGAEFISTQVTCKLCHLDSLPTACGYLFCPGGADGTCEPISKCPILDSKRTVVLATAIGGRRSRVEVNGVPHVIFGYALRSLVLNLDEPLSAKTILNGGLPYAPRVGVVPLGFSIDSMVSVETCSGGEASGCLGDIAGWIVGVGPLTLRRVTAQGETVALKKVGLAAGAVGANDTTRRFLGIRTAQAPDGSVYVAISESTPDHAVAISTQDDVAEVNKKRTVESDFYVDNGKVMGWERTRLVKVPVDPTAKPTEWILEQRSDANSGCNLVSGYLGALGVKDCGNRLKEFHVIDASTVVLVQNLNSEWPANKIDLSDHSTRLLRFDVSSGAKTVKVVDRTHCGFPAECGWRTDADSLGWGAGSKFSPWVPVRAADPYDVVDGIRVLEVDRDTLEVVEKGTSSLASVGLKTESIGGVMLQWTRLQDGGAILSFARNESFGTLHGFRYWMVRLDIDLNILWSRPIGVPAVGSKSYGWLAGYGGASSQVDAVRSDGSLMLNGAAPLSSGGDCSLGSVPTPGLVGALVPATPYGDLDCSPTPDLCKGLNVAIDCDDNDASTIDDCQHSVGCYHIPWSFYEGLAAALPGGG